MKRPDRFFFEALAQQETGAVVRLEPDEVIHATKVKRHALNARIELFDGKGRSAMGTIVAMDRRRQVDVRLLSIDRSEDVRFRIHIVTAVPKGDRMETLLDMATQLGVTRITPVVFQRSVHYGGGHREKRWHRVLVESCKQSRRNHLLQLDSPIDLHDWLAGTDTVDAECWIADPDGKPLLPLLNRIKGVSTCCRIVIGPEGGIADEENRLLRDAGYIPVALGSGILRVEAAVVAFSATLALITPGVKND